MPRVYPPIEGRQANPGINPSLTDAIGGFSAGIISTLVVHPFDVVKTRLQVMESSTSAVGESLRITRSILNNEGGYSALYRGLMPNMIGNSISWALYFLWYGNIKEAIGQYRGTGQNLTSFDYFLASGASGVLTALFTNPIWVVKTRMLSTARNAPGAYTSIKQGTTHLWRTEGVRGFYRGLTPSLFGVSHGAIQFMTYEQLKNYWAIGRGGKERLTNADFLLLSAVSKMIAGSITYPYQVVRSRLQVYDADKKYKGATDVVRKVWAREGLNGFYKGLGPNLVRVLPSTCVTFLVYENTKFYLPRYFGVDDTHEETED